MPGRCCCVQRDDAAFAGKCSLPGVLVRAEETFDAAARRALRTKAGLDAADWYLEQIGTFGKPDRDTRGRVVSVAHMALERCDETGPGARRRHHSRRLGAGTPCAGRGPGLRPRRYAAGGRQPRAVQAALLLAGLPAAARDIHPARAAPGLCGDPGSGAAPAEHREFQEGLCSAVRLGCPRPRRRARPEAVGSAGPASCIASRGRWPVPGSANCPGTKEELPMYLDTKTSHADLVVVGSGVAGLSAALAAAEAGATVLLLTAGALLSGSSPWAQGGIAAALGADDDPALHAADTTAVGGGLNDAHAVQVLVTEGQRAPYGAAGCRRALRRRAAASRSGPRGRPRAPPHPARRRRRHRPRRDHRAAGPAPWTTPGHVRCATHPPSG